MDKDAIDFRPVTSETEVARVTALARSIWTEHYTPIIGAEQVAYMLETLQSPQAIQTEIDQARARYFLIRRGDRDVGYLSFSERGEALFLSKVYFLSTERGAGLGRQALAFVPDAALRSGAGRIWLTVNRENTAAIKAYERMGFVRTGEVKADIGSGYFMDDYRMEWSIGD